MKKPGPPPSRSAAASGYTDSDARRVKFLANLLASLVADASTPVALSALVSAYARVAHARGDVVAAAEQLVSIGGQILIAHMQLHGSDPSDLPAIGSPNLH